MGVSGCYGDHFCDLNRWLWVFVVINDFPNCIRVYVSADVSLK